MANVSLYDFAVQNGYSPQEAEELARANPDLSQGAPAGVRAGASFLSEPADKLNYVRKRMGEENVAVSPKGDILWRKPQTQKWMPFDEPGLSWSDVADFAGDVPELVGGMAGAAAGAGGASVIGAGVGSGAGNIVKQVVGRALLGQDSQQSAAGRALEAAASSGLGAGGQAAGNLLARKLAARGASAADDAAYAAESQRLADAIGGSLTKAQQTGNRNARIIEDQVRRNAFGGQVFEKFELEKQVRPLYARLDRIMDSLVQGGADDANLGTVLRDTFQRTVTKLDDLASTQARQDARLFDELVGRTPVIPMERFAQELAVLSKFDQELAQFSPEARKLAQFARGTLESLKQSHGRLSADQLQSWMHQFTQASAGRGVISDAFRPGEGQQVAARFMSALQTDLDNAAQGASTMMVPQGVNIGNAAKLLKQFRENYANNRAAIGELERTVLAKRFGGKLVPESVERDAEWIKTLRPQELERSMEILEINRPGIRELTMRNIIEDAVTRAEQVASKEKDAYGRIPLSMDSLRLALPNDDKIKAILGPNSPTAGEIADVVGYLNRATARTLSTMSNQETWVKTVVGAMKNPSMGQLAVFAPRLAAEAMTSPDAFKWLRTLARTAGKGGAVARRASEEFSRWALPRIAQYGGMEAVAPNEERSNLEQR